MSALNEAETVWAWQQQREGRERAAQARSDLRAYGPACEHDAEPYYREDGFGPLCPLCGNLTFQNRVTVHGGRHRRRAGVAETVGSTAWALAEMAWNGICVPIVRSFDRVYVWLDKPVAPEQWRDLLWWLGTLLAITGVYVQQELTVPHIGLYSLWYVIQIVGVAATSAMVWSYTKQPRPLLR